MDKGPQTIRVARVEGLEMASPPKYTAVDKQMERVSNKIKQVVLETAGSLLCLSEVCLGLYVNSRLAPNMWKLPGIAQAHGSHATKRKPMQLSGGAHQHRKSESWRHWTAAGGGVGLWRYHPTQNR